MNNLEEFLRNEGVLYKYLKNTDFIFRSSHFYDTEDLTIQRSFKWDDTEEGYDFWLLVAQKVDRQLPKDSISKKRVLELRKEYKIVPPRYREVA